MIIALSILFVIVLCGMTFTWGFLIGKGKIEIKRKLSDEEKKKLEESEKRQQEAIEKFNNALTNLVSYNGLEVDE